MSEDVKGPSEAVLAWIEAATLLTARAVAFDLVVFVDDITMGALEVEEEPSDNGAKSDSNAFLLDRALLAAGAWATKLSSSSLSRTTTKGCASMAFLRDAATLT
jgi:hypothetical protein